MPLDSTGFPTMTRPPPRSNTPPRSGPPARRAPIRRFIDPKADHLLDPLPDGAAWYVAQAEHRREFSAAWELRRQGFSIFLPHVLVPERVDRWKRPTAPARLAYLPSYLLVAIALDPDSPGIAMVNRTRGIASLVNAPGGTPRPVRAAVLADLMGRVDAKGCVPLTTTERAAWRVKVGQLVRITGGPFSAFEGMVSELLQSGRVRVDASLFGRTTPVDLPQHWVEDVESVG